MKFQKKSFYLFILLLLIAVDTIFAQCAMCKATVENSEEGKNIADSLNYGIVYLMALPYILFGTMAYFMYKKYWKKINEL